MEMSPSVRRVTQRVTKSVKTLKNLQDCWYEKLPELLSSGEPASESDPDGGSLCPEEFGYVDGNNQTTEGLLAWRSESLGRGG